MVVAMDMAKGNQVASMTQVVLSQEDLAETVEPSTHQSGALLQKTLLLLQERSFLQVLSHQSMLPVSTAQEEGHDFENDQYTEQFTSFEFEQDSFNTIHFGRNLKGRNHSNILFDEIDELARVLTDLRIQGASDPKDSRPVSNQYKGPVLKCRFKVDSGAYGNLLPYNIYRKLFPGMPDSITKSSTDHTVCLLAYNKEEIK